MIMQAALWVIFSATVLKTVLVTDAVWDATGRHGLATRAAAWWAKRKSRMVQEPHVAGSFHKGACLPLAQPAGRGSGTPRRKTRPRSVHVWLLSMHFLALLAQGAAVFEYLVPVTDETCLQTRRVMISTFILFDSASVMFLLAKADVTSRNRASTSRPALWERVVKGCSYFWACVWMPVTAAVLVCFSCGGAAEDGQGCNAGFEHVHAEVRDVYVAFFLLGKSLLGVQLLVLLLLFLRPIIAARGQQGKLSALHRRTVVRNITCAVGVTVLHLVEGVIVCVVMFSDFDEVAGHGSEDHGGSQDGGHDHQHDSGLQASEVELARYRGSDAAQMIQTLLTLCLTEITITLGFTTAIKSCLGNATRWSPTAPESRKTNAALLSLGGIEGTALPATASNSDGTGGGRESICWKERSPHTANVEEGCRAERPSGAGQERPLHHTATNFEANDASPCG